MQRLSPVLTATSFQDAADAAVALLADRDAQATVWVRKDGNLLHIAGSRQTPDAAHEVDSPTGSTILLEAHGAPEPEVHAVALALASARGRLDALELAAETESRLDESERIGGMGSFVWDVVEDVNRWSSELYRLYGRDPSQGAPAYEEFLNLVHPDDRERVSAEHGQALAAGGFFELEERIMRPDGEVRTLWTCGEVVTDDKGVPLRLTGVCRDVTEDRIAEAEAVRTQQRIAAADVQRRQALELNDTVVQGLVALLWRLEDEALDACRQIAEETLAAAKSIMRDLLRSVHDGHDASVLLRSDAAGPTPVEAPIARVRFPPVEDDESRTIVLADDAPEVRTLLRILFTRAPGIELIGEAGDGAQAVDLVRERRPDVVVLDLSMPVLDGLEAARRIREETPGTRIIVFSGYPAEVMRDQAIGAGAHEYVEKTASLEGLVKAVVSIPAHG
ncbi:MAG: response regulator [Actinomycetota bacterium]